MELNEMKNLPQRKINNNKINGKIFTLYASESVLLFRIS